MRLYHVMDDTPEWEKVQEACHVRHILVSFAYLDPRKLDEAADWIQRQRDRGLESLFLDCGAFTAHKQGGHVDLDEYEQAIATLKPDVYVQLDVIGDPEGTKANLARMVDDGLRPLPVFTRGAPMSDLLELRDQGFDYVALGNMSSGRGTVEAASFLREVFRTIGPTMRTHAFGCATPRLMVEFPFYSCDAASAAKAAAYGIVRNIDAVGNLGSKRVNVKQEHAWQFPALSDLPHGEKNWMARRIANVEFFERLQRHVTKVWSARGVEWDV